MEEAEITADLEAAHPSKTALREEIADLSEFMQQKLDTLWSRKDEIESFTIFRIPRNIRKSKKNIFEPFVVSIGPFYHGKESLRTMEEKKWRLLRDFLSRGDDISLNFCLLEMKALEEKTRRCYSETVDLDSDGFVQMMLLDACFVLQYFLKYYEKKPWSIFEVGWNWAFICSDLLLLENQIPFFVVLKLCEIGVKQEHRGKFINFIRSYMAQELTSISHVIPNPPLEINHLVHLCYHCSVPNPQIAVVSRVKSFNLSILKLWTANRIKDLLFCCLYWVLRRRLPPLSRSTLAIPNVKQNERSVMVIPCATELQDSGVKFRAKRKPRHMLDISFQYGVLEIPRFTINDNTKPLLMNLVAFEQCKFAEMKKSQLTSFVSFLDSLVNTTKDVLILQQCGVIENCLSSEEELTHFFNQLCQGLILADDHFLAELFKEVNRHYESSWNRQRARLIRDYFSSPWAVISLIAAFILLVLTCVQSFFAVYAYFRPPR
ncbi:hypothetical protein LUZ63_007662 [Rhynchospora breviuscula]|uniref:Uncharacterized protein n=1 Tax=Rhynchospora breviuscula TaxID=2022672 RepID=A0A9Q0HV92_9POAL|nr:hypothetical protein LUZ63_007662 [Rhynchospora breviuscula]